MIPALVGIKKFLELVPREVWYALAFAFAVWWAYDWAYDRGYDARDVECKEAELQARVNAEVKASKDQVASDKAATSLAGGVLDSIPPIEGATNESSDRVRIVYRTLPAASNCTRPDGVRVELEGARSRANAAARQLQRGPGE